MLVDARLVAEGVGADDGFVGLDGDPCQAGHQAAGAGYLGAVDIYGQVEEVAPGPEGHDNLLEGGVAGPLTDAVDGALHLPGAGPDSRQGVGYGQAQGGGAGGGGAR